MKKIILSLILVTLVVAISGCTVTSDCPATCPEYSSVSGDFCPDGNITTETDDCGCPGMPVCVNLNGTPINTPHGKGII